MNKQLLTNSKWIFPAYLIALLVISLSSCSDDDGKPVTLPQVITGDATNIEINSATIHGEITSSGNGTITASGFVYSSIVSMPTLADDKIEMTTTMGALTAHLDGLSSGTTYNVRAYATNSVGTGYGGVVNITTDNAPPSAINISITGDAEVGKELTATYSYNDSEGDAEGMSTFQWYVADDAAGANEGAIDGATALTYTIRPANEAKYLRIGITPKATAGNISGTEVKSAFVGAVGEATTVTFTYNGQKVTYGIITSATGRKWLDRNLGAANAAGAVDDYANYGDLFQWGRLADGHQLVVRTGPENADASAVNGTTPSDLPYPLSTTDDPGHALFIIIPNGQQPVDWRSPQNNNLWQGIDGANNPCPSGWRPATKEEWDAENITGLIDGFSKLKLTYTGSRSQLNGSLALQAISGNYWASSIGTNTTRSTRVRLDASYATLDASRAAGYACRCIKN